MRRLRMIALVTGCSFSVPAQVPGDAPPDVTVPPQDSALDAPPADPRVCPAGFMTVAGAPATSRYLTFAKDDYNGATGTCASLGTHLVRLDTQGEATGVESLIDTATTGGGDTRRYRVLGRRSGTSWIDPATQQPLPFLPWGAGEPTSGGGEDCMLLKRENSLGVTGADQCTTDHEFACECE